MPEIGWDVDADAMMSSLEADPSRRALVERVEDAITQLVADAGHESVRRRRYQRRDMWGIPLRDGDDDRLLLWRIHPEDDELIVIQYLGPDI